MRYAKVVDNKVVEYPYSINDFRRENRNVSFPNSMSEDFLKKMGLYEVEHTPIEPYDVDKYKVEYDETPVFRNGKVLLVAKIVPLSAEEKEERLETKRQDIRSLRNHLLSQTDWRFRSDMKPSQEWIDYCAKLRDITNQPGFPENVVWPDPPEQ